MLFALVTLIAAQFPGDAPLEGRFEGHCQYPPALAERAAGTALITCTRLTVDDGGIAFGLRGWETEVRFEGAFDGERLTVERIVTRHRGAEDARGLCQLYYANEDLSTVACTAVAGPRSYAANFIVSRINP